MYVYIYIITWTTGLLHKTAANHLMQSNLHVHFLKLYCYLYQWLFLCESILLAHYYLLINTVCMHYGTLSSASPPSL
uniref:Uncharacterized protein n=1 Tax=Octopus bimaculoides TaxID=37653 RepID=A0A0L8GDM3_OCTBM